VAGKWRKACTGYVAVATGVENTRRCIGGHLIYAPPKITHGPHKPSVSIKYPRENRILFVIYSPFVSRPMTIETGRDVSKYGCPSATTDLPVCF